MYHIKNKKWMGAVRRSRMVSILLVMLLLSGCSEGKQEEVLSLEKAAGQQSEGGEEQRMAEGQSYSEPARQEEAVWKSGEQEMIYVHVCGAVAEPGVVKLPRGSRAQEAVTAAGGFNSEADPDYVNLAALLDDGMQLYIPTREEAKEGRVRQQEQESGLVNLNTADAKTLCTLPGIGESRALDIISYREAHGLFSKIEEIMQVQGIKESTFEKLKGLITVN